MTMYRFINRDGWERWLDVDTPTDCYYVMDRDPLPQGRYVNGGVAELRAPRDPRREFYLVEWRDKRGEVGEMIYVEDYDTSLLRHRSMTVPALAALSKIAGIIDAPGDESSQLDRVAHLLSKMPADVIGRRLDQCYEHGDCRRHVGLGVECRRTSLKRSTDARPVPDKSNAGDADG